MKPNFVLPQTKMCVVVWYRNGKKNETLIDTPRTNAGLFDLMLMRHHVGYSEIRAIKSVEPTALLGQRF
jgi:aspartate carbamoyltransferase catalytic subunit